MSAVLTQQDKKLMTVEEIKSFWKEEHHRINTVINEALIEWGAKRLICHYMKKRTKEDALNEALKLIEEKGYINIPVGIIDVRPPFAEIGEIRYSMPLRRYSIESEENYSESLVKFARDFMPGYAKFLESVLYHTTRSLDVMIIWNHIAEGLVFNKEEDRFNHELPARSIVNVIAEGINNQNKKVLIKAFDKSDEYKAPYYKIYLVNQNS